MRPGLNRSRSEQARAVVAEFIEIVENASKEVATEQERAQEAVARSVNEGRSKELGPLGEVLERNDAFMEVDHVSEGGLDGSKDEAESEDSEILEITGEGRRVCDGCRVMGAECMWKGGSGKCCEACLRYDRDCVVEGNVLARRGEVIELEDDEDDEDDEKYAEGLYLATLSDSVDELVTEMKRLIALKKELAGLLCQIRRQLRKLRVEE